MLTSVLLIAAALVQAPVPPVPGLCVAPMPADPDTPGCYKTGQLELLDAPRELYWHLHEFPSLAAAASEAARHRWASIAQALHGSGCTCWALLGNAWKAAFNAA